MGNESSTAGGPSEDTTPGGPTPGGPIPGPTSASTPKTPSSPKKSPKCKKKEQQQTPCVPIFESLPDSKGYISLKTEEKQRLLQEGSKKHETENSELLAGKKELLWLAPHFCTQDQECCTCSSDEKSNQKRGRNLGGAIPCDTDKKYPDGSVTIPVEYEGSIIFRRNLSAHPLYNTISVAKLLFYVLDFVETELKVSLINPKLFLGSERLCLKDEIRLCPPWMNLTLETGGGGGGGSGAGSGSSSSTKHKLSKDMVPEDLKTVFQIHGFRKNYDLVPDLFEEFLLTAGTSVASSLIPKLRPTRFHFAIQEPYPPAIITAIKKYMDQDSFENFNLHLNLLNKVTDEILFQDLMEIVLGSYQTNLPDIVYRDTHLSEAEWKFYKSNLGKKIIYKPFLSTNASPEPKQKKSYGPYRFQINLKRGKRNGVFYIGKIPSYPFEEEVILCAYGVYLINEVKEDSKTIDLDFLDYVEYHVGRKKKTTT